MIQGLFLTFADSISQFQEGVMSRNLYFFFEDGLINVEDLDARYQAAALNSVFAASARSFYTSLLRPRAAPRAVDADLVSAVWHAVQWRTTTHSDDETLAIAPLFGLDRVKLEECVAPTRLQQAEKTNGTLLPHAA